MSRKIEKTPEYIAAQIEKNRARCREWYQRNLERERDRSRTKYYADLEENRIKAKENEAKRRAEGKVKSNLESARYRTKLYRDNTKRMVQNLYGNKCACCGETNPNVLTLDHVNNDGAERRGPRYDKQGKRISKDHIWEYQVVLHVESIRSRYQLLCFNCNCAKGKCGPHQSRPLSEHWWMRQQSAA